MRRLEEKPVTRQLPEAEQVMRLYAEAFPDEERIPESELWQMACREQVEFTAYYDVGTFCGFTFCIDAGRYLYIVYLAVDAQARAKGYGSRVLAQLRERHPHATFVLEIEPLDEDAPNLHQRIKRLAFYERNGFTETGYDLYDEAMRYTVLHAPPAESASQAFDAQAFKEAVGVQMGDYHFELRPARTRRGQEPA